MDNFRNNCCKCCCCEEENEKNPCEHEKGCWRECGEEKECIHKSVVECETVRVCRRREWEPIRKREECKKNNCCRCCRCCCR